MWSDVIYLDVGDTKNSTRNFTLTEATPPASAAGNLSLDMKSWLWTIAGMYTVARSPDYESHALFGARMAYVKQTLDWAGQRQRRRHRAAWCGRPQRSQ